MSFETSAGRENGYYGKYTFDAKKGAPVFHPLGREILLDRVTESIEGKRPVTWTLSFEFEGAQKIIEVPRKIIADNKAFITELADAGADVPLKHFHLVVDTLRQRQEAIEMAQAVERNYERLGWLKQKEYDSNGQPVWTYSYRGNRLIGSNAVQAVYSGPYMVKASGSFDAWKQGVLDEVIGHTPMEIVLLAGLSAPVNGLIAPQTTGENPIFHINGISGSGKTTGLELAVSVSGAPFQGAFKEKKSLLSSWGATGNSLIKRCEGNRGVVVAVNEIGKCQVPDMTPIVYNLSEGTDKERLTTDLKARCSEAYFTTFISTGEISLLERCKSKVEGLAARIVEITDPLTDSAAHSDRIKSFCRNNFGHAAPMLAKHIIDNGGLDYVLPIYRGYCQSLVDKFPENRFRERFIEKFPALILTTAKISSTALGIPFDLDGVLDYFIRYAESQTNKIKDPLDSYDILIQQFRTNINCFIRDSEVEPRGEVWGRITYPQDKRINGKRLTEEYAVRRCIVERILEDKHFHNLNTCIQSWIARGVFDYEDKSHPCRKRRLVKGGAQERVYVFLVFDDDTAKDSDTRPQKLQLFKPKQTSQIKALLDDREDESDDGIA